MRIEFPKGIPQKIAAQVMKKLDQVEQGIIIPDRIRSNGAKSVKIGLSYRALQLPNSDKWLVLTHSSYNHYITKGRVKG